MYVYIIYMIHIKYIHMYCDAKGLLLSQNGFFFSRVKTGQVGT